MTQAELKAVTEQRIEKILTSLVSKNQEYARADAFSNFTKTADLLGCERETALLGFWIKHVISIVDHIQDLEKGKVASYGLWSEKIGDAINYLIILEGMILERLQQ